MFQHTCTPLPRGIRNEDTLCIGEVPGLCSNALAFASANANAAFALALAFGCHVMDVFALAFAFDSSAFAFALAFDSNAFDWIKCETHANQMTLHYCCRSMMFIFLVGFVWNKHQEEVISIKTFDCSVWKSKHTQRQKQSHVCMAFLFRLAVEIIGPVLALMQGLTMPWVGVNNH